MVSYIKTAMAQICYFMITRLPGIVLLSLKMLAQFTTLCTLRFGIQEFFLYLSDEILNNSLYVKTIYYVFSSMVGQAPPYITRISSLVSHISPVEASRAGAVLQ